MQIKNKQKYYLKRKDIISDNEGGKYEVFSEDAIEIEANIYPVSGGVNKEIYGEVESYIYNMLYDGPETVKEGDGICVFVSKEQEPDYKIKSILSYSHKLIVLEQIK